MDNEEEHTVLGTATSSFRTHTNVPVVGLRLLSKKATWDAIVPSPESRSFDNSVYIDITAVDAHPGVTPTPDEKVSSSPPSFLAFSPFAH